MSKFQTKNRRGEKSFRISNLLTVTVVDTWRGPRPGEIVFDTYAWDEIKKFVLEEEGYREPRPSPKPWHTPNHLEIWALTIHGCQSEAYIYREGSYKRDPAFHHLKNEGCVKIAPTDPKIIDAHRIWPER